MNIKKLVAAALLVFVLAIPSTTAAFDIHTGAQCDKAGDSSFCQSNSTTDPLTGSDGILLKVTRIIAVFAGAVEVIIMIIAGIRYMSSGGNAEDVAKAKKTIIYAAVGLVVIGLAQTIINYVIFRA